MAKELMAKRLMAKWLRAKGKVTEASLYTPEAKGLGGFVITLSFKLRVLL